MAWADDHTMRESHADGLIRRGTLEQTDGNPEEAESLLRDALSALQDASAPDDPALIPTLSALGKLLADHGAFEDAEPLLARLLAIAEAQGAGRPDVAAALVTLATVRHALGRYASAEELLRQALDIYERTRAPNDVTTAETLESLAETCAARGRGAEAIAICTRALTIRETTLGANDTSVRAARKRIADLQLEAQESHVSLPHFSPSARQSSPSVDQPRTERRPTVSRPTAALVPWASELAAVREEIESGSFAMVDDRAPRRSAIATAIAARSSMAIAVVAAVVVVLAVLELKSLFGTRRDPSTFVEVGPFNAAAASGTEPVAAAAVATVVPPSLLDSLALASTRDIIGTVPSRIASRPTSSNAVPRDRPLPQAPPRSAPVVSPPSRANVVASSASRADVVPAGLAVSPPAKPVADSVPARAPAPEARGTVATSNTPTSPTLIGTAPQPQYPEALSAQQVEGEVVVQFVVDETGRPDLSSMTVVRSPHVLLTNAARAVLPQFRFEPARTAQSIPRPETVRYAFTFRAPRR